MIYPILRNRKVYWRRGGYAWESLRVLLSDLKEIRDAKNI